MKRTNKPAPFRFVPFSKKQHKLLTWWMEGSPVKDKDAIICDGSVRAGKTIIMSLSYIMWAMENFNFQNFGMAGKTIGSFRRNVLFWLKIILKCRGYKVKDHRGDNLVIIRRGKTLNYFYIFGGKDESSQDLVQGITCAGFFFDEVSLMPESFVNQCCLRCSVENAKLWFNCNPASPYHWFKLEWIDKCEKKNAFRLHFVMEDNPSLTEATKERYRRMYTGVFFKRYILGLWVIAEGVIYDMFDEEVHVVKELPKLVRYWVCMDYGTKAPCVFLIVGQSEDKRLYVTHEYRWDSTEQGRQKTDKEYSEDYRKWLKENGFTPNNIKNIYIDPSAISFMLQLEKDGVKGILPANNDVADGIRDVSTLFHVKRLFIHERCKGTIKEIFGYSWDEKAQERGEDKPVKANDHGLDALRYCVRSIKHIWRYWIDSPQV